MKYLSTWVLALTLLIAPYSILLAEEKTDSEAGQLSIEKIIADCEKQYNEQIYPDSDERSKLIDQCIDDNSASQPSAGTE